MYTPGPFAETDSASLLELMRGNAFATLVTTAEGKPEANHLPLLVATNDQGDIALQGHIAIANPLWRGGDLPSALAIFHGPQTYISPSAYPGKQQHGKVVPTWNYAVAHASGPLRFISDNHWKLQLITALTDHYESARPEPWQVADAPSAFTNKLLNAIVGFEIQVESLEGKFKLSQNQPTENISGVLADLGASSDYEARQVAALMARGK